MTGVIPLPRRILVAAISLFLALVIFHAQLAAAVVTRGDDALRAGDVATAMRFYARAEQLDPRSAVAADRLAFNLALRHDRTGARLAIVVASAALTREPDNGPVYADRAFAELELHDWRSAERDFAAAGALGGDARYDHFAARMALHRADRAHARRYVLRALALDPGFAPARALLRRLQ
jgi:tetratricopeptide (TPR) repeat protein